MRAKSELGSFENDCRNSLSKLCTWEVNEESIGGILKSNCCVEAISCPHFKRPDAMRASLNYDTQSDVAKGSEENGCWNMRTQMWAMMVLMVAALVLMVAMVCNMASMMSMTMMALNIVAIVLMAVMLPLMIPPNQPTSNTDLMSNSLISTSSRYTNNVNISKEVQQTVRTRMAIMLAINVVDIVLMCVIVAMMSDMSMSMMALMIASIVLMGSVIPITIPMLRGQ